jgi:hypothetical protein
VVRVCNLDPSLRLWVHWTSSFINNILYYFLLLFFYYNIIIIIILLLLIYLHNTILLTIIIININYCVVYLHTNIYLCRVSVNIAQQSSPPETPRSINSLFVYSNNIIRCVFLHIPKNIPGYLPKCTPVKCNCSFSLFFFICSAYMWTGIRWRRRIN